MVVSLRGVLAKAAQLTRRSPVNRNRYKQVWTALSTTEDGAKMVVQGCTDEAVLEQSALYDFARLRRGIRLDSSSAVLEIGCGVGRLGKMFAPLCRTWTGCDVSPHMLAYARRRLAAFDNARFVELSGYDLQPIADASQDIVYSTVVFMHLAEWDRYNYIAEGRRVLKPGGQLYIDNISLTTDYGWKMFESSRSFPAERRPPHIGSASTPQEFEAYLSHAAFASWQVEIVDNAWIVGMAVK
jgi:ubiquinone/menaquinone biosynthesis C-methylase UbiE